MRNRQIALAALLTLMLASTPAGRHAYAATHEQSVAAGWCCSAQKVAEYEARMLVRPINPVGTVRSIAHLSLNNFSGSYTAPGATVQTGKYNTMQYYFGTTGSRPPTIPVADRRPYVIVTEVAETRRAAPMSISPAVSYPSAGYYSPLEAVISVPHRHLTIFIESNIPRHVLYQIGQRLRALG